MVSNVSCIAICVTCNVCYCWCVCCSIYQRVVPVPCNCWHRVTTNWCTRQTSFTSLKCRIPPSDYWSTRSFDKYNTSIFFWLNKVEINWVTCFRKTFLVCLSFYFELIKVPENLSDWTKVMCLKTNVWNLNSGLSFDFFRIVYFIPVLYLLTLEGQFTPCDMRAGITLYFDKTSMNKRPLCKRKSSYNMNVQ